MPGLHSWGADPWSCDQRGSRCCCVMEADLCLAQELFAHLVPVCLLLPPGCQSITAPILPGGDAEPWARRGGLFGELQVRACPYLGGLKEPWGSPDPSCCSWLAASVERQSCPGPLRLGCGSWGSGAQWDPPAAAASRARFGARTTCSLTDGISSRHCCRWGTAVTSSTTRLRSSRPASTTSCAHCCPGTRWVPRPRGVARTTQCRADPRTSHGLRCTCANEVHARPLLTPRVELAVQGDAGAQGPLGCSPHSEQASRGHVIRPVSSSVSPCAGERLLWPGTITPPAAGEGDLAQKRAAGAATDKLAQTRGPQVVRVTSRATPSADLQWWLRADARKNPEQDKSGWQSPAAFTCLQLWALPEPLRFISKSVPSSNSHPVRRVIPCWKGSRLSQP